MTINKRDQWEGEYQVFSASGYTCFQHKTANPNDEVLGFKIHVPIPYTYKGVSKEDYDGRIQIIEDFLKKNKVGRFKLIRVLEDHRFVSGKNALGKQLAIYVDDRKTADEWLELVEKLEKLMLKNDMPKSTQAPQADKVFEGSQYNIGYRSDKGNAELVEKGYLSVVEAERLYESYSNLDVTLQMKSKELLERIFKVKVPYTPETFPPVYNLFNAPDPFAHLKLYENDKIISELKSKIKNTIAEDTYKDFENQLFNEILESNDFEELSSVVKKNICTKTLKLCQTLTNIDVDKDAKLTAIKEYYQQISNIIATLEPTSQKIDKKQLLRNFARVCIIAVATVVGATVGVLLGVAGSLATGAFAPATAVPLAIAGGIAGGGFAFGMATNLTSGMVEKELPKQQIDIFRQAIINAVDAARGLVVSKARTESPVIKV